MQNLKYPIAPSLTEGNKTVQLILHDLDKAKKCSSNPAKLRSRCEDIVFLAVSVMRKSIGDHLLQTTVVWALINILRLDPTISKNIMLLNGVPGILHQILSR